MSITSLSFIVFIFGTLILYYILPAKGQWILLLTASIYFYLLSGISSIIYILLSSVSIYISAIFISNNTERVKSLIKAKDIILTKEDKKIIKKKMNIQNKIVLVLTVIFNVSFLIVFKYTHFLVENINPLIQKIFGYSINNSFFLIQPVGISYYTLQAIGYVSDVYWGKIKPEKNPFKTILFLIFFPQITQGPISKFDHLSVEIEEYHSFSYDRFARGFQRMLWGYFKKMVIADALSPYVITVFSGYERYSGITCAVGSILYVIQLYADFSGYMDIMCGYCEMLGIHLTENFSRPFFSKSTAELWRRWHISLGAWSREYIFYPVAMSKWNQKLSRSIKGNENISGLISTTIPLLFVWLFVGIWHDASWEYIIWGLCNAIIIISSIWLQPFYMKLNKVMHINNYKTGFKYFQIIRTCLIFAFLETMAAVTAMGGSGLVYIGRIVLNHTIPQKLEEVFPSVEGLGGQFIVMLSLALMGAIMMFLVSVLQRKKPVRDYFNQYPLFIRIVILVIMTLMIASSGVQASWGAGAFMYANF